MSKKIIGATVGTPIRPQAVIEKTEQAEQIKKNAEHLNNSAIHVTEEEKQAWNRKSEFSGKYADLTGAPTIPTIPKNISAFQNDTGYLTQQAVDTHNSSTDAHNDIRLFLQELSNRVSTIADSDDTTLDQLSEIVAYIKANKNLIDSITTSKINVADIIDNLVTSVSNKPLSAKMGVELKKLIDAIQIPTSLPASDVYSWAKQSTKPTYTADEVGALPNTTKIPKTLAELTDDTTHRVVTDAEKSAWNAKANPADIPTKNSQLENDSKFLTSAPVASVNGKTGAVTLGAGDVGADASGTATIKVSEHNTTQGAHSDIRLLIEGLTTRLNALANSTDTDLDQLAEIVAYIKSNKSLIDGITTNKVNVADIIDNLTTNVANKPLSAKQGVELARRITASTLPIFLGNDATTYAEWYEAFTNGKLCIMYSSEIVLILTGFSSKGLIFNGVVADGTIWTEYLSPNGSSIQTTDITSAVASALETAKASGEFDGTSVSISSITQSTESGGTSTVTFSDGKELKIKNGEDGDVQDIREEISQLSSEIADLDIGIPDYVIAEAESTISKLFTHGNLGRTIRFIAISDTHEDSAESYNSQITISNKHAGQAIKYIADRIGIDFVAHLGDASSCGAWSTTYEPTVLHDDIKNINKFVFSGIRGIKTAFIAGNHDMISINGYSLLNSGAYSLFGNMCSGNKDRLGGWGYFDIDDANVRVMYLNTSDSPSSAAYLTLSQSQKNWLCETLIDVNTKDNSDEWKVILLSHAPLDFGGANISTEILLTYVNGGSYNGYSFDGKNNAQIISNIHGHVHCFSYGYIADKIRRFAIPNACFIGSNHYGSRTEYANWADTTTYNKTANSGKDTAFSLVTIDLDSGKCYVDNYGAGIDRVFSTDYKPEEAIVPTSISNISYSGVTTVGTEIDKSKFTFTVTYSNGTTNTVNGATLIRPTTISVVGNNAVTISYTEEGTTVTGTTTIVGAEVPTVNLLNLNRTYVSGTAGENIGNHLDESKAYLNAAYNNGSFNAKSCTVSNITENSLTMTEAGVGGISVAYPVHLTDLATQDYNITFDYSGVGKCRVWCAYLKADGTFVKEYANVFTNDIAGASGSANATIQNGENYGAECEWLVIYFTSNTSSTKTYTNVSLTKA